MSEVRLIDANALRDHAVEVYQGNGTELETIMMVPLKAIDNAPTVPLPDFKDGYKQAILDGKTNYSRPEGEWIPFSDRLPDKNMHCLVSVGIFNFTQIAMYSDLMGTINHKIFWQGDYGKNNFQNITEYVNAWQPLPEPYKGGAE